MKVVCIGRKYHEDCLTIGKTYEVIREDISYNYAWYYIINDAFIEYWYQTEYFKPLFEIRAEKINKLLEDES